MKTNIHILILIIGFGIFSSFIVPNYFQVEGATSNLSIDILPVTPSIISLVVSDPDGSDSFYSNGDVITVTFDKPTNRPAAATKTNLLNLFAFSQNLGDDFTGTWTSASVLKITIVNADNGAPTIGGLTLTVKESGNLRTQDGKSFPSTSMSPALTGDFGVRAGPDITSLSVVDPKDPAIPGIDAGDVITVRFSEKTNQPVNTILDKTALDTLFEYKEEGSPVILGSSYQGTFTNSRTLQITIITIDVPPFPTVGGFTLTVKADGNLKDINNLSSASEAISPPLSGTFGQAQGPKIIDLVAKDPFGSDAVFGDADTITMSFDVPTNRQAGDTLQKNEIDALYTFSTDLDSQYNGRWFDSQTFVMNFTDAGDTIPQIGSFNVRVNEGGDLKNKAGTSLPSSSSSPFLRGNFGIKTGPVITSVVAADPKTTPVLGIDPGDTITITFDEPTNQPPVATKSNIDAIFTFSKNLGSDYTGVWFNPSKLVITIQIAGGDTLPTNPPDLAVSVTGGNLKNSANTSLASVSVFLDITGNFGQKAGPSITAVVAHDPKDTVIPGFDNGDTISIIFSEKTNEPFGPTLTQSQIDQLFTFSQSIGDDYSGVWTANGDLVITILDGEQLTEPPKVDQLQVIVKETAGPDNEGLLNEAEDSLPSKAVSPFLSGNFGSFIEEISLCEEGEAFTTFPDGKTAEISFAGNECGGFTFEVADEETEEAIEFLGEFVNITPTGGTDCSVEPFCTISFVFRESEIPDDIEEPFTENIFIFKDVDESGTIEKSDPDTSDEVFNGLPNSTSPCVLGTNECTPRTKILQIDSARFEAKALSPSNSKFAIGGIKALAVGALAPSVSAPSAPSAAPSAGAGAGAGGAGGGGGGNAASVAGEGEFAGTIDLTQVKLYEATWDKCDEKMLRVIAGPAGPGLSVKAVAAMGGIIAMSEAATQPYLKATVYETPISEIETFIRVQVEGVIGREASLAQRSLELDECTGSIGGYSESEEFIQPASSVPLGAFPSAATLFEDGSMFDTNYNTLDFSVSYLLPNGEISQMNVNEEEKAVTFILSEENDGRFILSLPRGLINANDDRFILLNDKTDETIDYEVLESGVQYATLELKVTDKTDSITIIGTTVVPEFGSIVMAILVISILCIVIISRTKQISLVRF